MSLALHWLALTAFICVAGVGAAEVRAAGLNTLYRSAIDGIPNTAMFAKGGHKQLSDDEIRSLVDYMLRASGIEQPLLLAAQRTIGTPGLQRHPLDAGATQPGQPADAGGDTAV